MTRKVSEVGNTVRTQVTGRQYVDTYLSKGTTFSRIQTSKEFENFAFYATYMKQDSDKYMGLLRKEITANTIGYVSKFGNKTVSECGSYVKRKSDGYLR